MRSKTKNKDKQKQLSKVGINNKDKKKQKKCHHKPDYPDSDITSNDLLFSELYETYGR